MDVWLCKANSGALQPNKTENSFKNAYSDETGVWQLS
jgi:hypothetical protein